MIIKEYKITATARQDNQEFSLQTTATDIDVTKNEIYSLRQSASKEAVEGLKRILALLPQENNKVEGRAVFEPVIDIIEEEPPTEVRKEVKERILPPPNSPIYDGQKHPNKASAKQINILKRILGDNPKYNELTAQEAFDIIANLKAEGKYTY